MKLSVVKIVVMIIAVASSCYAIQLEIWVMSQCPYCAKAEKSILTAINKLPEEMRPEIEFNYVMIYDTLSSEFISLHGENEVTENLRQLVIQKYYPAQFFDYIMSRSSHYDDTLWIKDCFYAGINSHELDSILSYQGKTLGVLASDKVIETGITSTPSIFYNGQKIQNWGYDVPTIYSFLINEDHKISQNSPQKRSKCIDDSDCNLFEEVSKYRCSDGVCIE